MADGVKMKVPDLDKSMARLRKIAPNVDKYVDDALEKNSHEYVKFLKTTAPKKTGDLAKSINARKEDGTWTVLGLFYWLFIEHGTVEIKAQPFAKPTFRLLKKRFVGRVKRAMNKAVKEALK